MDFKFIAAVFAAVLVLLAFSFLGDGEKAYKEKELELEYESGVSKLIINEVLTSNKGIYADVDNNVCDYVEIYNGTDEDINLSGYGLSDVTTTVKFVFGDVTIEKDGFLVVSLTGEEGENAIAAPFRLSSSGGETIILTNSNAKVIDAMETEATEAGYCMARDENGQWFITAEATPGFENSQTGREDYLASLYDSDFQCELVINEFLARNKGNYTYTDEGFIEFLNASENTVNLSSYYISGDASYPFKKQLPDVELEPGQIYVMYQGGKDDEENLGISFTSKQGQIILGREGKIVSNLEYSSLPGGIALIYSESGYLRNSVVSPGYENTAAGIEAFQQEKMTVPSGIVINEIMNNNTTLLPQNGGRYYDWVELYNNSEEAVSLSGLYLSTSDDYLTEYAFPDVTVEAGAYYIIMCSGDENLTNDSYYHTCFKIGDTEQIILSDGENVIDTVFAGMISLNCSYGRAEDFGFVYSASPTPGKKNTNGDRSVTSEPVISPTAGVYETGTISVEIEGNGEIHYTLDGSEPESSDPIYTEAVTITKTTVVKAASFSEGMAVSETVTSSYILNEGHTMPVISISLEPSSFSRLNSQGRFENNQMKAYVEFFDGDDGFSSGCGLGVYGASSRRYSKKNFVVRFGSEYGVENLTYKLFDDRDTAVYTSFALRGGSQDISASLFRDELGAALVDDYTDVDCASSEAVIVYINGNYWGIYNLREKKSKSMLENHYSVQVDGEINRMVTAGWCESGDRSVYYEVKNYCTSHDLSVDEYYDYVCTKVDVQYWCDYFIAEMYVANPDFFNMAYFQSDEMADGKWRLIMYDLDLGFEDYDSNYYWSMTSSSGFPSSWIDADGNHHYGLDNVILRNLFKNEKFRQLWLERLSYNLKYTWNRQRVLDKIDEFYNIYLPEIERNQKRWGHTVATWSDAVEGLREFVRVRQDYILSQTKSYFKLTDEQMQEYFGEIM